MLPVTFVVGVPRRDGARVRAPHGPAAEGAAARVAAGAVRRPRARAGAGTSLTHRKFLRIIHLLVFAVGHCFCKIVCIKSDGT